MSGWSLKAGAAAIKFPFGVRLEPGKAVRVWSGPDAYKRSAFPHDLVWSTAYIWKGAGDEVKLYNPAGEQVDSVVGKPVTAREAAQCAIV